MSRSKKGRRPPVQSGQRPNNGGVSNAQLATKLDLVVESITTINSSVEAIDTRLDGFDKRFDSLETRVAALESKGNRTSFSDLLELKVVSSWF